MAEGTMKEAFDKCYIFLSQIHGRQTLDENIADNGGIRIAYEAYCTSLKFDGPDQSLPGINLTQKQLFFLSFGQLWCKHKPRASAINSLHTDVHSPAKARVNVVLQNMKEFAETFNCPKGSPMNPEKKCVIW
ncbi:membrane metallo-endopeptidase-like 1 [Exaiptasia diaphana]|uniref:Peptidase M13 C-terminal domain-containing protein n=1 Tax=Exaiptasia diaphana TaxID=2652724 RepID=A0A913YXV4_EXADI|nr:membrane metallo-endopeptidase-like 1 [Exaiptasia diaphana]